MEDPLIETWNINNRMCLYVLDAITPEALGGVSASKGRSVGATFAWRLMLAVRHRQKQS